MSVYSSYAVYAASMKKKAPPRAASTVIFFKSNPLLRSFAFPLSFSKNAPN